MDEPRRWTLTRVAGADEYWVLKGDKPADWTVAEQVEVVEAKPIQLRLTEFDDECHRLEEALAIKELELERLHIVEEAAKACACVYYPVALDQADREAAYAQGERTWRRLCEALGPEFNPSDTTPFFTMIEKLERLTSINNLIRESLSFETFLGGYEAVHDQKLDMDSVRRSYNEWKRR